MALVEVYIEHGLRVTRRYEAGNGELFEGISASSMGGFGREGGWGDRQGEAGGSRKGSCRLSHESTSSLGTGHEARLTILAF